MPRRVEDIIRSDKRSIRNIKLEGAESAKESRYSRASASETEENEDRPAAPAPRTSRATNAKETPKASGASARSGKDETVVPIHKMRVSPNWQEQAKAEEKKGRKGRRIWIISVVVLVLIVVASAYVASVKFSRATFKLAPVVVAAPIEGVTVVASATTTANYLHYEISRVSGTASTSIPAIDGPYQSTKATGGVTIYNAYSNKPQRLIAGTRMTNESGLIYRLTSSVTIPASATSSNGTVIPGSIRATISGDQAGAQYNITRNALNENFKMVAYEGGPRYNTIYAKLRTDVTGGFEGRKKTVNQAMLASSTKELQAALTNALRQKTKADVPAEYVFYDNVFGTTFETPITGGSESNVATLEVKGTFFGILFKRTELAAKLAGQEKVATFRGAPFNIEGLDGLKVEITNPKTFSAEKKNSLIVKMSGNISLSGKVPTEEIKRKLAGLPFSETQGVFSTYSSVIDVSKSSAELFPSWATAVPNDLERITVELAE